MGDEFQIIENQRPQKNKKNKNNDEKFSFKRKRKDMESNDDFYIGTKEAQNRKQKFKKQIMMIMKMSMMPKTTKQLHTHLPQIGQLFISKIFLDISILLYCVN